MRKQLLKAALLGGLMTASFLSSFGQVPPNDNCGTVLNFDGTNDYVTMEDAAALNFSAADSFSVEAWFKTKENLTILSKAGGVSPYKGYQL